MAATELVPLVGPHPPLPTTTAAAVVPSPAISSSPMVATEAAPRVTSQGRPQAPRRTQCTIHHHGKKERKFAKKESPPRNFFWDELVTFFRP